MIAMLVLGLGVMAYAKSTSATLIGSIDNAERQRVALLATDMNNVFAAHVNTLGSGASQQQVISAVQTLAGQLSRELQTVAQSRGYTCNNGQPVMNASANPNQSINSTVFKSWMQGPPVCAQFTVITSVPTGFNGVWMQTQISWLAVRNSRGGVDTIRIPSLIAPN
ncbi:MAG TPA: hypothetical protein VGE55_11415 [Limnobacter sp.]